MLLYFELFIQFFFIGALSFGGGYASLPLIQSTVVERKGWLSYTEFADVLTLSEVTPGPIAINAASFAGYRTAGFGGSIAATLGCAAPSCILVSIIAILYVKYRSGNVFSRVLTTIRPAVCAMVFSSFVTVALLALFGSSVFSDIALSMLNIASLVLFAGALILMCTKKIPPVAVILISGICGVLVF